MGPRSTPASKRSRPFTARSFRLTQSPSRMISSRSLRISPASGLPISSLSFKAPSSWYGVYRLIARRTAGFSRGSVSFAPSIILLTFPMVSLSIFKPFKTASACFVLWQRRKPAQRRDFSAGSRESLENKAGAKTASNPGTIWADKPVSLRRRIRSGWAERRSFVSSACTRSLLTFAKLGAMVLIAA